LARDALASVQLLVRVLIEVAYLDLPIVAPARQNETVLLPDSVVRQDQWFEVGELRRAEFDKAITLWNSARYGVLLGMNADIADLIDQIDRELDRLTDIAFSRRSSREEFRGERAELGRLIAGFLDLVRREAGLPVLKRSTIWSWDGDPSS
jgi:hypothetical protein